jgi:hypothetical protein
LAIARGTLNNERSHHPNRLWKEARSPDCKKHQRNLAELPVPSGSDRSPHRNACSQGA